MRKFKIAVCQLNSQTDKKENLAAASRMIAEAAGNGAELVCFPENVSYMGRGYRDQGEPVPGETSECFADAARTHDIWIVTGSFPETAEPRKPKNTTLLIDPAGQVRGKYSKIHMFDMNLAGARPQLESATVTAGDSIVTCETELCPIGLAICYDLRFGELFRLMALAGARMIVMPTSFTRKTGDMHWEPLVRARAIENGVYMIAPDQCGRKSNMLSHGHSMIVDPWGRVLAEAGGEDPEILYAEIDPEESVRAQEQIGSLKNRREDLYHLTAE